MPEKSDEGKVTRLPVKVVPDILPDKDAGQEAGPSHTGEKPKPWDGLKGREASQAREDFCLLLRESGFSLPAIAKQADFADASGARKAANRALKRQGVDGVPELRLVLLNRLERLLQAVWRSALSGDLKAVAEARRLIEQEAIMSGANAPTRLEVFTLDAIDQELQRLEAELAQLPGPDDR